jgi:2,4-dienoyl-CoA reductase-like NADH-dependent reductase (Old Yellow Enzyme family)
MVIDDCERSAATAVELRQANGEGFDFVVLGRGLVADPGLVSRMRAGELERTRRHACNRCGARRPRDRR